MLKSMNEYQAWTDEVAIYPEAGTGSLMAVIYVVLGLVSEAGEVAGKLKKVMRDEGGEITPERLEELLKETGDAGWYMARIYRELGSNFYAQAHLNREKLTGRKERGVIGGSGDNR